MLESYGGTFSAEEICDFKWDDQCQLQWEGDIWADLKNEEQSEERAAGRDGNQCKSP